MKPLLYVDGYNIIGAWPDANRENWPLDDCRDRLIHLLQDYAGYTGQEVCLVFDGYKADRPLRSVETRADLTVVYTRHGETADHYIERMCQQLPKYREARVATSDSIEQTLILGRGATRLSARTVARAQYGAIRRPWTASVSHGAAAHVAWRCADAGTVRCAGQAAQTKMSFEAQRQVNHP